MAKQPPLDWLRFIDPATPAITLKEIRNDPSIYLLPESDEDPCSDVLSASGKALSKRAGGVV